MVHFQLNFTFYSSNDLRVKLDFAFIICAFSQESVSRLGRIGLLNTPTTSLQRGVNSLSPNDCPDYDIKYYDGLASGLEFWEMWNTPSLALLLDPLWLSGRTCCSHLWIK